MGKHAPLSYDVYFITPEGERVIYAKRANTSYQDKEIPKMRVVGLEKLLEARREILEQIKKKGPSVDLQDKVIDINQKIMGVHLSQKS